MADYTCGFSTELRVNTSNPHVVQGSTVFGCKLTHREVLFKDGALNNLSVNCQKRWPVGTLVTCHQTKKGS